MRSSENAQRNNRQVGCAVFPPGVRALYRRYLFSVDFGVQVPVTTLVVINTRTGQMRRYEGRRRTHKVVPSNMEAHPLSAAYVPVINELRTYPERFFPTEPKGAA
jgi:hypothetical protein